MTRLFGCLFAALWLATPATALEKPVGPPVSTLQDLGTALWSCWFPPAGTQNFQVTISFSFKRNGDVLGKPRITYSTFNGNVQEQKRIMGMILTSLEACTPVSITPQLGGAIAGRVFTMTFTSPSTES